MTTRFNSLMDKNKPIFKMIPEPSHWQFFKTKINPAQAPHVCHGLSWGEYMRGLLPSTMGVGVIPYNIFENLHTKSCTMDAFHDYFPGHANFGS